ncbi:MAG: phosphatidate cytidylyltransferase [Chlamydiales bacterium]
MNPMNHFKQRLIFSAIAILYLITLIYYSHYPFVNWLFILTTTAAALISQWEYYRCISVSHHKPLYIPGLLFGFIYLLMAYWTTQFPQCEGFYLYLPFTLFLIYGFSVQFLQKEQPINSLAVTSFGLLYVVIPLSMIIPLNYNVNGGSWWLIFTLSVTKMTDAGAYFIGKWIGRRPLAKTISPNKTLEGSIGGLFAAVLTGYAITLIARYFSFDAFENSLYIYFMLAICIGIVAQIGDLGESLLKRDAGVKDSNDIPGLGGMLDIVDSLLLTIPLVYFFVRMQ